MSTKQGRIRIGVGGWTYAPWRGTFFPEGLPHNQELRFAADRLTSIEINGTYYRTQTPDTFTKWHDQTPDDFVFAVKAPRAVTNRRVLAEAGPSIERFFASGVTRLGDKLGPVNWQFMPSKRFDPVDFSAFLRLLPDDVRHAIEVRHDSFATPAFADLARDHGIAIVLDGDAKYPAISELTAPFVYARIMGTTETEAAGYSDKALDVWASQARDWANAGRDVFLYVISGFKERDPAAAMALLQRVTTARSSPDSSRSAGPAAPSGR